MPIEVEWAGQDSGAVSVRGQKKKQRQRKKKRRKRGGQKRVLEFAAQIVEGTRVWPPASP